MMYAFCKITRAKGPIHVLQVILFVTAAFLSGCAAQNSQMTADSNKKKADAHYQKKEYEKAKKELLLVLKKSPYDVDAHYRLGVIYAKEESKEESRSAFEKVLSLDPEYSKAYYNLAVLHAKGDSQDDVKKSIRYFDQYIELEPDSEHRQMIENWKSRHTNKLIKGVKK